MALRPDDAAADRAAWAVVRAIKQEGPQPRYHREVMARHRNEWPTLWEALDELMRAYRTAPPKT